MKKFLFFILYLALCLTVYSQKWENPSDKYNNVYKQYINAPAPIPIDDIKNYVYFSRDREAIINHSFLVHKRFDGAQIMYSWAQLEPIKDNYDFSLIREDIKYLEKYGKKLFLQLQDATFTPEYKGIPEYLFTEEYDGGGISQISEKGTPEGWVAKRWNKNVRIRFALLLDELGKYFDGKIEGINLQETAIGIEEKDDASFTTTEYAEAIKINMQSLKRAFPNTITMQYANFMPGEWLPWDDKGYLRSIYEYGNKIGVGLGAPDLMVQKKGQLNHALAMMHESSYNVKLGIAVQDGNYIGQTNSDRIIKQRDNIVPMLYAFAKNFLKVNYIFWSNQKPYFEEDVLQSFLSK